MLRFACSHVWRYLCFAAVNIWPRHFPWILNYENVPIPKYNTSNLHIHMDDGVLMWSSIYGLLLTFEVSHIIVVIIVHCDRPPSLEGCISLFLCWCFAWLVLGPPQVCPPIATSVTWVFPPPLRWFLYCFVQHLVDAHCQSALCFRQHLPSSLMSWTVWPYQVVCFECSFCLDCWHLTSC